MSGRTGANQEQIVRGTLPSMEKPQPLPRKIDHLFPCTQCTNWSNTRSAWNTSQPLGLGENQRHKTPRANKMCNAGSLCARTKSETPPVMFQTLCSQKAIASHGLTACLRAEATFSQLVLAQIHECHASHAFTPYISSRDTPASAYTTAGTQQRHASCPEKSVPEGRAHKRQI